MRTVYINHRKGERPRIDLTVVRVEPSVWRNLGFDKEHYLTQDLNKSCKCLLFEWNGVPVAFVGVLNTPRKGLPYGCAVSRLVVLPDYQGLGLSMRIFKFVGGIVKAMSDDEHDYRLYIKTAHRKFGEALSRSSDVDGTSYDGKGRNRKGFDTARYPNRLTRVSYCKQYVGPKIEGYDGLMLPISYLRSKKALP